MRASSRLIGVALSVKVGCILVFAAYLSSRLAVDEREFVLESPLMAPWSQAWLIRGDEARFRDMDTGRAIASYWQAVGRNPLLFGGWFALARLERQSGDVERAEKLHDFLLTHVPPSTAWSWNHLLLAADRGDEARFRESFNFVLANLPRYRQEAVEVAMGVWSGWTGIIDGTDSENKWAVLEECMARKDVDAGIELYSRLEEDSAAMIDKNDRARFIDFLLVHKRWMEAVSVWKRSESYTGETMVNGGFEANPSGKAFDWRQGRVQGVEVRKVASGGGEGLFAMRFNFLGTTNLRYDHFWQYVPLEPGQAYELRFLVKSQRLSTDRGPYLELRGVDCPGLRIKSPEFTGSESWKRVALPFHAPDECRMARVGLRRDESLKFDSKIAGELWLDAFELVPKRAEP